MLFALTAGVSLMSVSCCKIQGSREVINQAIGRPIYYSGIIKEVPRTKDGTLRIVLANIEIHYERTTTRAPCAQLYIILSSNDKETQKSDKLVLFSKLSKGFGGYDATAYRPRVERIEKPNPPDYAVLVRNSFSVRLRAIISDAEKSSLALGYLVGEKNDMSEQLSAAIRNVGLAHAVVASGFHLGVIVGFAKEKLLRLSRFASV